MASLVDVFVNVLPKTDKFEPDLKRRLSRIDAGAAGEKIGKSVVGGISKAFVGLAAAVGGISLFKSFIDEAKESAQVGRLTNAVIKSTGGVAKVSANQIGALATAISNKVGVDDEAIQSSQNLLLTFTRIRNEAGKGNDVFNQASTAIVDMTAAMNGGKVTSDGLKTSTIQVGKALNDPIKGITALSKVGVTFTKGQKDQIAAMVKAGKTAEAQKIILKELGTEFGGAAAAATDPAQRLGVVVGNIKESIGLALLPVLEKAATFLADRLPGAIEKARSFIVDKLIPGFKGVRDLLTKGDFSANLRKAFGIEEDNPVVRVILKIRNGIIGLVKLIGGGDFSKEFRKAFGVEEDSGIVKFILNVRDAVIRFAGYVQTTVIPAVREFAAEWLPKLARAAVTVAAFFREQVYPTVLKVGGFLRDTFGPTVKAIAAFFTESLLPALAGLKQRIKDNAPQLITLAKFFGAVVVVAAVLVAKIAGFLLPILLKLAGFLTRTVFAAIGTVIGIIGAMVTAISKVVSAVQFLYNIFTTVWGAIKSVVRRAIADIVGVFLGLVSVILTGASKAFGWIPGIGPKLKTAAKDFNDFKNKVNNELSGVKSRSVVITAKVLASAPAASGSGGGAGRARAQADGGILTRFANGAENHIAQVARAGEMRLWAEPETGGEAYIPLAPQKRARSTAILSNVAQRFGYGLTGFANGGLNVGVRTQGIEAFGAAMDTFNARLTAMAVALGRTVANSLATPNLGGVPSAVGGNAAIVQRVFASMFGWSGPQWAAAFKLISGESGFRNTAQNPTSSAYGMFQFLNGTWGTVGGYKTSDPTQQAIFGGRYIAGKYGNPVGAYSKWLSRSPHWYDSGGYLPTGVSVAVNNTGRPERVLAPGQSGGGGLSVGELHLHDGVDLDLLLSRMGFAERAGSFT